jgi:transposase InsO family protein
MVRTGSSPRLIWSYSAVLPTPSATAQRVTLTVAGQFLISAKDKGRKSWSNEHEARLDAFRWLTRYNTRRQHSRLGQRSPIAYENDLQPAATTLAQAA